MTLRNRKYKSGTSWCFWRWTETPSNYILRLHLLKTPWFAVCLHWINGPDPEPDMHDHPVCFLSLILRGYYIESRGKASNNTDNLTNAPWKIRKWLNIIRASDDDAHKICWVHPDGALTLCFMGPKTREWKFHTKDGLIPWKEYNKKYG